MEYILDGNSRSIELNAGLLTDFKDIFQRTFIFHQDVQSPQI